ncbi:MAG TPA: T9SS type A sorting domain-containing protein [Candidatus Kapabacteria bacterium]|nr:T9SS type A sorting domain-containing protein [Candidatus Kapabacteria bacterium]
MKPIYRSIFVAGFFIAPLGFVHAQPLVSSIMPLGMGQYVSYNQYDTAYSHAPGVLSHSSFTVIDVLPTFQGMSNVSVVLDSLGNGDPTGVHTLHYAFTAAGDLQVYADTAFLASQIPSPLMVNDTNIPNKWVDVYKTSVGTNATYPILTTKSSDKGIPVTITLTGEYMGVQNVQTPSGTYSTAYRFEFIGDLSIAGGLAHLIDTESDWLAQAVGIVKTQLPIDSINIGGQQPVSAGGREKEMIAFGVVSSSVSQSATSASSGIQFFPNPASDNVTLSVDRPANHVFLYDATGRMVRSFDLATRTGDALLWVKDMPNGMYLARVQYANGTSGSRKILIQH